jgi:predicted dehydrogenase
MKNNSMSRPHIALIGCGDWGKLILRDLKKLGCYVTVVTKNSQIPSSLHADACIHNIDDLPVVDGIVIATETVSHAAVIKQVDKFNRPIFVEKPVVSSIDEISIVKNAINADKIYVMDKWRYHPGIIKLAEIVEKKELGNLLSISTTRINWSNPHIDVDGSWILLPHDISIIQEIVKMRVQVLSSIATEWGAGVISLSAHLTTMTGIKCSVEISTCSPLKRREITIVCEQGVATLSGEYGNKLQVFSRNKHGVALEQARTELTISDEMPLYSELEAFVNFVAFDSQPPKSTLEDGIETVELIQKMRTLAGVTKSGKLVT